ncbi:MAG: flagellar basal-body rod protein FlgC [Nevskia sp.]|nr:flagellar basal-body rod protein FlgC [Nevskia sp.]
MSDYLSTFAISASGMNLERLRLEVAATNLANAHTTRGLDGQPFRPLRVIARALGAGADDRFGRIFGAEKASDDVLKGVGAIDVVPTTGTPRLESDPGNPTADARGFVALPQVNPVEETVTILAAVRAYEANVRAFGASKTMALKALEIGAGRNG